MRACVLSFIFSGLTLLPFSIVAQITGATSVSVGQTVQYRMGGTRLVLEGCPYWSLSGNGTIVNEDARTATINWTAAGTSIIWFSDDCAGIFSSLSVTILGPACAAATPNTTFSYSANTCGTKTVTYPSVPPSGETWYWQDNTLGTSTANSSSSYQINTSGTYYLRSYANCGTWSSALATTFVTFNPIPSPVASFSGGSVCGTGIVNLTASPGANANSVKWYETNGTFRFTGLSYQTPSIAATTTYYARSINTSTGCESAAPGSPVVATVNGTPPPPNPANSPASRCGPGSLTLTAYPPYGQLLWYTTTTGGSPLGSPTSSSIFVTPTISSTTTYYAEHIYGGCASATRLAVTATINPIPTTPVATGTTVCYGKAVTLTATPGSNGNTVRWYNQSSGGSLLQTGISFTTPQLTGNATYFLSSLNTSTNCESSPRMQVNVPVDQSTNNQNYIKVEDLLVSGFSTPLSLDNATVTQKKTSYQYFDGLGRLIQSIGVNDSPTLKNTISPVAYDQFGRTPLNYLPYTVTQECIDLRTSWAVEQAGFYNPTNGLYNNLIKTDYAPFSATVFEASPLNRILQQGAPGSAWQPDPVNPNAPTNKAVKTDYLVNVDGTAVGQERIAIFNVVSNLPTTNSFYASGTLYVNVTRDEENRQVRTYVDKEGRTILKKVQYVESAVAINDDTHWALTYYVYDDIDNLRFVLPPEFCARLTNFNAASPTAKQSLLNAWAFQYLYDMRQRMLSKQVPGASATEMVYDKYNRLVLTRDGNQRNANKWLFTKYDQLNRPILIGEYSSTNDRTAMETAVNTFYTSNPTSRFESTAESAIGYTTTATFPNTITSNDLLTITYYDNYSFISNLSLGTAYNFALPTGFSGAYNQQVRNLTTGSKIKIVGSANWLVAVSYYDDRYRLLQTIADDHKGNKNRVTNAYYGITNWVTKSLQAHGSLFTRLTETDYDHRGRVLRTFSTLDGGTRTLLAANTYNELGQLVEKNLHSTDPAQTVFLQSNDYRYNIRGWMTHINNSQLTNDGTFNNDTNDLFGMQLLYNEAAETVNGTATQPQFNGNIAATKWKMNNLIDASVEKIYNYTYDPLNRLKSAGYATGTTGAWTTNGGNFDEQLAYDKNGNITSLNRYALFGGTKQLIDQLAYEYKGGGSNQLQTVTDGSAHYQPGKKDAGFVEATHAAGVLEMDYDYNGNLKYDLNKSITAITYNYLNLPTLVTISGGKTIEYTYDAGGTKLKYKAIDNGTVLKESDYINGIQYEAGQLAFVMTGEGRAMKRGTNWEYEYHLKDHLGNTRVAFGNLQDVDAYMATMEPEKAAVEEIEQNSTTGLKYVANRRDGLFNHTVADKDSPVPSKSAWLNGAVGREVGPGRRIDVTSGDKLKLEVYARYVLSSGNASDVVASLVGAVTTAFNITAAENLVAYNGMNNNLPGFSNGITYSNGDPKAYFNYILFNTNYTSSQYGYVVMPAAAANGWQKLSLEVPVPVGMTGFAYVWVSNESNYNVYFDDLKIIHEKTTSSLKVVQAQDYYPFGLAFNNYQRDNTPVNRFKYNDKELQDEFALNWEDYGARMYMAEIGRWISPDPLADERWSYSPYNFVQNNPIIRIDPDGMLDDYAMNTETGKITLIKVVPDDKTDKLVDSKDNSTVIAKDVDKGILKDGLNIKQNGLETTNVQGGTQLAVDISKYTSEEIVGVEYKNSEGGKLLEIRPYEGQVVTMKGGYVDKMRSGASQEIKSTYTSKTGSFTGTPTRTFHTHPGHPKAKPGGHIGTAIPTGGDISIARDNAKSNNVWIPYTIFGKNDATIDGTTFNTSTYRYTDRGWDIKYIPKKK